MTKTNNTPSNSNTPPPNFSNSTNNHHPQMGVVGNYQNQNLMQPFIPNMQQPPPPLFMNAPMSHMGPQNSSNYNNPMFPVHGQQLMHNSPAQMNLSQQILAQSIMNLLQQPNMNMNMNMNVPNGQFCAPYPMQNMNQQLPMQRPNLSQVVPYGGTMQPGPHPMYGFPNQMQHAMIPQNPMFSGNSQFGVVPGNQVRPQIDPNEKNWVPTNGNTNAFVSGGPFPSQQLQGNISAPHNTNNAQSSAFRKSHSQENPNSNIKTNFANSNWKGSPNKNFHNKPNKGGIQGGFQKSKSHDNKGNRRTRFQKEHKGKGPNNERAGNFGLNSEELQHEPKRSFSVTYSEQEIQQWREARRKNHPFRDNIEKKPSERLKDSKVIDRELLQKELKEVLAKQVELGIEVAEIPSYYLKNAENQGIQSEGNNTFNDQRKLKNKARRRNPDKRNRGNKKQKLADRSFSENKKKPTLLQKLLSADIKRDKSHLFQVFRFMAVNSFFKNYPDKPLIYPSAVVKETGSEVYGGKKQLQSGKDALEHGNKETVQKHVIKDSDNGHDNEDEESDEGDDDNSNVPSLVQGEGDNEDGIDEFDEEEGEILQ